MVVLASDFLQAWFSWVWPSCESKPMWHYGDLRGCGLECMNRFFWTFCLSSCHVCWLRGLGMLTAPEAYEKSLVPKNFSQIVVSSSCYLWPNFMTKSFWPLEHGWPHLTNFGCNLPINATSQKPKGLFGWENGKVRE